jgi:uncharacterized protein
MNPQIKPRIVRCPRCGGPSEYGLGNVSRPFCSERCKNHDFGAWASESYRVGDAGAPASEDEAGDHPPRH